jgi:hypothetical protein
VPLDLLGAGAPVGAGVTAVYTVINDAAVTRHCTRFAATHCTFKTLADATAAKLVCKDGVPATCP